MIQRFIILLGIFLFSGLLMSCQSQSKEQYLYEAEHDNWLLLELEGESIQLSMSQNPAQKIPLEIVEEGENYKVVQGYPIESKQRNASGGPKIAFEPEMKLTFEGEQIKMTGLFLEEEELVFSLLQEDNLVLFLPVRRREVHTRIGQSAFYKDEQVSESFYKNLEQVICNDLGSPDYEKIDGKIYVSVTEYQNQELMWNYTNKAEDEEWLATHPCE